MQRNLARTAEIARQVADALEAGDLVTVGDLMNEQWELKLEPEATRAAMAAVDAPELRFDVEQRGCTAGPA